MSLFLYVIIFGFGVGLSHCIGMCSPFVGMIFSGVDSSMLRAKKFGEILVFSFYRVLSYCFVGVIVGLVGAILGVALSKSGAFMFVSKWIFFALGAFMLLAVFVNVYAMINSKMNTLLSSFMSGIIRIISSNVGGGRIIFGIFFGLIPCGVSYAIYALIFGYSAGMVSSLHGMGSFMMMVKDAPTFGSLYEIFGLTTIGEDGSQAGGFSYIMLSGVFGFIMGLLFGVSSSLGLMLVAIGVSFVGGVGGLFVGNKVKMIGRIAVVISMLFLSWYFINTGLRVGTVGNGMMHHMAGMENMGGNMSNMSDMSNMKDMKDMSKMNNMNMMNGSNSSNSSNGMMKPSMQTDMKSDMRMDMQNGSMKENMSNMKDMGNMK